MIRRTRAAVQDELRSAMVETQLVARGVSDPRVIAAMRTVPRHSFVSTRVAGWAYADQPLPIGSRQTISQPYMVALMAEALILKGGERVLEIGTGSGYAAAVLAHIAGEVHSVERIEALAMRAAKALRALGYDNVHVHCSDGTLGWQDAAPFDGIVVTAGGPDVPPSLKRQLKLGGRLLIPVEADLGYQELVRITRCEANEYVTENLCAVRFVPLIGKEGWYGDAETGDGDPALE